MVADQPELRKLICDRPVPPPEGFVTKPISEHDFLLNARKVLELVHDEK